MYREKFVKLFNETLNDIVTMFKENNVEEITFNTEELDYDEILKVQVWDLLGESTNPFEIKSCNIKKGYFVMIDEDDDEVSPYDIPMSSIGEVADYIADYFEMTKFNE